ncbi:hypothetical protein K501DRAFT_335591 [Backusella circina FSU 941]|nr:hypothetical protein K501DRAFT_335591 [Backusella circina FSU 941]
MSKAKILSLNQPSKLPATPMTTRFRKSPITLLKEECLELRKKTSEDELLIAEQTKEIERIKLLLQNNTTRDNEQSKNMPQLENKIDESSSNKNILKKEPLQNESESNNNDKTDKKLLSEISPSGKAHVNLQDEIEKLEKRLDIQEYHYQIKLEEYKRILEEKDSQIQRYKDHMEKIKTEHKDEITQLKHYLQEEYKKLEEKNHEHSISKKKLEKDTNEIVQNEFERILYEFEQEQHSNKIAPVKNEECDKKYHYHNSNRPMSVHINQQWWAQKFVPTDAVSWPSPQPLSNLKKMSSNKGLRM